MADEKVVRNIEDDFFKVKFEFTGNYLSSISFEIKDRENIPAIDLENVVSVSHWCNAMWGGIQRMFSKVPEKMDVIGGETEQPQEAGEAGGSIGVKCSRCKIDLVKKKPCCGGKEFIYRCPSCGIGYRLNPSTGKGKNLPPE